MRSSEGLWGSQNPVLSAPPVSPSPLTLLGWGWVGVQLVLQLKLPLLFSFLISFICRGFPNCFLSLHSPEGSDFVCSDVDGPGGPSTIWQSESFSWPLSSIFIMSWSRVGLFGAAGALLTTITLASMGTGGLSAACFPHSSDPHSSDIACSRGILS